MGDGASEIEPLRRRPLSCSAWCGASWFPQSGQVSKPAALASPITKVVLCRSTVTSVLTTPVLTERACPDLSCRKSLARSDSHW